MLLLVKNAKKFYNSCMKLNNFIYRKNSCILTEIFTLAEGATQRICARTEQREFVQVSKTTLLRTAHNSRDVALLDNFRKAAFTLAEVLITLGIIGIVAAMTLPSVMNETRNKQSVTAFKKLYSNFQNAIIMFKANNGCEGFDVASCISGLGYGDNNCDAFKEVAKIMNYAKMSPNGAGASSWVADKSYNYYGEEISNGYGMVNKTGIGCFYALPDGIVMNVDVDPNGFKVMIDTNGKKKPNRMGKDVHAFTVGCGTAGAELEAVCVSTQKDVFPFVHQSFPNQITKGLCTFANYLSGGCNEVNMFPNEEGGATPSLYILMNDKLPDYKEIAASVPGFKQ